MESKNIYQRLNAIMIDVRAVNKQDKKVNNQYKFVSHDSVSKVLHDPLANHGVMMIPTITDLQQDGNRTAVQMEIAFVNIDKPEDRLCVNYWGYGIDQQDKGIGKAVSYAVKYCLLKTFCLETGDDVEKDNVDYRPEPAFSNNGGTAFSPMDPITEEEYYALEEAIGENEEYRGNVLKYINKKWRIKTLKLLPNHLYKSVLKKACELSGESVRESLEESEAGK